MKSVTFLDKQREYQISPLPCNTVEAMAYVPYQNAEKIYNPEQGLCNGTIFPKLDKPFEGYFGGMER